MIPLPKIGRPKQVRAYSSPHFDFRLALAVSKVDRQQNTGRFNSFANFLPPSASIDSWERAVGDVVDPRSARIHNACRIGLSRFREHLHRANFFRGTRGATLEIRPQSCPQTVRVAECRFLGWRSGHPVSRAALG